jgi:hypothetical protein
LLDSLVGVAAGLAQFFVLYLQFDLMNLEFMHEPQCIDFVRTDGRLLLLDEACLGVPAQSGGHFLAGW